ncbi:GNAT family N-acetyltransferase [Rhodovulum sp. DZ06]|uniref:GNAT family N-acetyltransferase n=1 Tax=Rhodovulum sp. DZ06 TaxID=3425126 RepID=UPI003D33B1FB
MAALSDILRAAAHRPAHPVAAPDGDRAAAPAAAPYAAIDPPARAGAPRAEAAPDAPDAPSPEAPAPAAGGHTKGIIRSLLSSEREKLTDHFLRLSEDDLRRRFHGPIKASVLEDHVDEAFAPHRHVIGWFQDHALRGVVELDEHGPAVEAAVTVEKPFRGQGVGHALLARALDRAAARGHEKLVVHTTRSNSPMVGLAKSLDAELEADGPDVSGLIPVQRAKPMKLLFDLAMDEARLAALLLRANRRFWTGGSR